MTPPFDLQGGVPLCAARALCVGALLSVFGTMVFRAVVAPKPFARMPVAEVRSCTRRLLVLTQGSLVAALVGMALWLVVQAVTMADVASPAQLRAAVPEVLTGTVFGHVLLAQAVCVAGSIALVGWRYRAWRWRVGLGLATLALCLQAGHSHAYSMHEGPSALLACDVLHLLGAGAWLGGLAPLLLVVWGAAPRAGATAARWFSPLGQACIAALVVSAAYQGWVLIATLPGVVGTGYGWMALGKLALFGVLLGFAAVNRYRFAPALLGGDPAAARRVLVRSIALQTGAALAIVVAASVLSELPPAMHEQPMWPFAHRFSLDAISEDVDFRAEVLWAGAALCGAAALLALAFMLRRWRWAAAVAALVIGWFALPHLDLLLVPAYPTSFYRSPTGFAASSIVQGRDVYAQNCMACHGADGRGDHPAVAGLKVPPADLTAAHLWMHSDGELFWWVSHGITTPEGAQAMPGFAAVLDEDARWAVIDFIRARNAGTAMEAAGNWTHPLQAPDFGVMCGGEDRKLSDWRGHFLRLRFAGRLADIAVLAADGQAMRARDVCSTDDATVASAYGVVSGLDAADLDGSTFLIDEDGWLRAVGKAGGAAAWRDPAALGAAVRALRARPVGAAAPMKMPM